jgi:dTDP-4-amino-4,6-dideoxygalactose transaminase
MVAKTIPVADPHAQFLAYEAGIRAAIDRVLTSGRYVLGDEVRLFEEEFASFLGARYCIGVASGTDALALALRSVGIESGDEVITVSHTAVATVAAIEQIGAIPVFVDIDPVTRCLAPSMLDSCVTPRTKALVPVHIYGQPAPMKELKAAAKHYNLKLVEDCAQAHGASINGQKVGTFGDAAAFSFYPTKNLGAIGDGGAVVTNSLAVNEKCSWLREYGWRERYISYFAGINSRLDEIQAAILRVKLPFLEKENSRRREIAHHYSAALADTPGVSVPAGISETVHAMHLYVLEHPERDALRRVLLEEGIGTALHYPQPVHLQPAYVGRIRGGDLLPETESLYQRILSLPMYPQLSDEQVGRVCAVLSHWQPLAGFTKREKL